MEGFFHVATHGGFRRAVQAMPYPLTEPALHQQVRKLERALGVTLLEQAPGRRMVPTAEGRTLFRFVAPFFEQLPGVLRELIDDGGGSFVLATEPFYVDTLCVDGLRAVQRKNPRAQLEVVESSELAELCTALTNGRADLGVASVIGPVPPGLVYERLGGLGLELLVPKAHPLAKRRGPLGVEQLDGLRCVLYAEGTTGRDYSLQAIHQAGFEVEPAVQATSAIAMRALVRAGVAPAFIPTLIGSKGRPRRKVSADGSVSFDLTSLLEQTVGTLPPFGFVRRAGRADRGLVSTFVEAVRSRLG
jgi:DNA-binding transcriptional LysR family regulator